MPLELTGPGVGRELKAGTRLLVEIRYARIGTPVKDTSRIRLLTTAEPPTKLLRTRFVASEEFTIPADAWSFRSNTTWTVPYDLTLHAIVPYVSNLGTDFKANLKSPDGREHSYSLGPRL